MGKLSDENEPVTEEETREKDLVEAYLHEHSLETSLNEVINQIVTDRPEDPYMILSALLYAKATSKRGIYHVQVREILDGNAIPTILVSLHTGKGIFEGVCSSETSGKLDKVDFLGEEDSTSINLIKRYNGKGYKRRAQKAQEILISKLENIHPTDQQTIDGILMELESEIGRNICMAASIAAVKAGAKYAELMSFAYIAKLCEIPIENACTPLPVFSIINGGKYGANKIFAQEILLTPNGVSSFSEALQLGTEFTWYLKNQLENRGIGFSNSGSFGGFCPQMSTLGEVFQLIKTCMEEFQKKQPSINDNNTSMNSSFRFDLGVDFGANEFVLSDNNSVTNSSSKRNGNGNGIGSGGGNSSSSSSSNRQEEEEEERVSYNYNIDKWVPSSAGQTKTSEEMLDMIRSLIKEFELTTIIDPFDKADIKSFSSLLSAENDLTNASGIISPEDTKKRIYIGNDPNCRIQIVGHKLLEYQGLENIQQERACNTLLIQTSNFSTMSTLLKTIADARRMGITIMLGASAGESHDAGFLGDLAMGSGIGQVKFGGLSTPDCIERYNQILLTSEEPYGPPFVGETFRR